MEAWRHGGMEASNISFAPVGAFRTVERGIGILEAIATLGDPDTDGQVNFMPIQDDHPLQCAQHPPRRDQWKRRRLSEGSGGTADFQLPRPVGRILRPRLMPCP